ncbi:MAG: FkbM family methyltransferase [Nitrospirae bacterium]|nr:FkbM family methyltransferase [Nitrospirota bacterium]
MKILFYCGIHNLVNFSRIRPYFDMCYGFDANPDKVVNAGNMYKNDPNVKFIYGALTEKSGEDVEFTITTNWDPASSLGMPNPEFGHMISGLLTSQKKIKVPAINLHDFCITNNIQEIDTLITDLQGMDLTVLKSLKDMIQKGQIREIQCEVEPDNTPPRYLGIPESKFSDFTELLSENYDVLWIDPVSPQQAEAAWEMDVRWRVKGEKSSDHIEFIMERELLVPKVLPNSFLKSYSQYGEDVVIDALLSHKKTGVYIDIGANDPDVISNTKLFYNRGWCGINIEPEPNLHAKLCEKRVRDINLKVGVGPEAGTMTFYRMSADTLSSFNKQAAIQAGKIYGAALVSEEPAPVVKLVDILESHLKGQKIDFLSVDAEGYDLAVLKSNDWNRYRPSLIIIEINVGGNEIVQFLEQHDYLLVFDNRTNGIFVSKEFCTTIDHSIPIRGELAKLEQEFNLRTVIPHPGSRHRFTINIVYGHLRPNYVTEVHRGNVSILWSQLPIEGCDHYAYHNSFSYRGKRPGLNILVMLEPAVVLPGEFDERVWKHFDYVFTLFDALIGQDNRFKKILFPRADGSTKEPVTEMPRQRELLYPLMGRKNAICMISGNKHSHVPGELYSKRIEVAEWFSKNSAIPFDVYGRTAFQMTNYCGAIPDGQKISVLKQYRYSLCFENTNHQTLSAGYITEKILDCFEARTVPIYLGASNIGDYISEECFIDFRRFAGLGELDNYLRNMSQKEYEGYVSAIDAWIINGNLRKYSSYALYDSLVEVCAGASSKSLDTLFDGDRTWTEGKAVPPTVRAWQFISNPVMWSWKHLSSASPPELYNNKIIREQLISRIQGLMVPAVRDHKFSLIRKKPAIKVLVAGAKYNSGNAQRGYDYNWWNMYDALNRFEDVQVQFYDFVTEAQQRGVAGMSDRLMEIVRKEQFDLFLYSPFNIHADILPEALRSITDHTDTQTIIWMNDDRHSFDYNAQHWAPCVDHIITTSHEDIGKYQQAGFGHKVIKSQWAFNPFTYQQMPGVRTRDMSFVGSAKDNRSDIIEKIRQNRFAIDVFGFGWPGSMDIPYQDMVRIYNQTKINLNIGDSIGSDDHKISKRIFEIPGCRGFLLTTPADHLEEYYEPDREVVLASSPEELIDKSMYYLSHVHEREVIAQRGYERTIAEHTWTHRLLGIFNHVGFPANAKTLPHVSPSPFLQSIPPAPVNSLSSSIDTLQSNNLGDNESIMTSIIVLAYNQIQYTRLCVESILHYTTGHYELLLVDNGSTDGTYEYFESVKTFHPNTRIIRNYQNRNVEYLGNYVASLTLGKYIVAVTNDTIVHEGWLHNFIGQIESAPDIAMVGPRSNNISGPQAAQAEYDTLEAYQTFAAEWGKNHKGSNFETQRVVGMLYIIKKEILERIGGWDPDLPTNGRDGGYGFSDDDLTLRLLLAGYRLIVANDVFIHHFGSVTTSRYRADMFGPSQNINKEKYFIKLNKNERIEVGQQGKLTLMPYEPDDLIPVAENTVIRFPRIAIVERGGGTSIPADHLRSYTSIAEFYRGEIISPGGDPIQPWLIETMTKGQYDFIVLIDKKLNPSQEKVRAIIDIALGYPDAAITVPTGNYAPLTHAHRTGNGKSVEIIQYADMSISVINGKLIRPCIQGLAISNNDEEMFWFLQRRVRGEGFFIIKAGGIVVDADIPCNHHSYDTHTLPEQLVQDKKLTEAISIYKDDLSKDPTFAESLYKLACIAKELHNISEALQYAVDSLEIDPHYIQTYIFLSRYFLEQGDMKDAEDVIRLANLKQPGNPEVQQVVAEFEQRKNNSY